jgi:hypothetical protein
MEMYSNINPLIESSFSSDSKSILKYFLFL